MSTNIAPQNTGRPTGIQDRIQALNSKVNQPMVCGSCGSTHFTLLRAEQFADNGYNSAQIRSLSMNTEPLYICICGAPVVLKDTSAGKNSDGPRAQFLKSIAAAVEFQRANQIQGIAQGFVSIAEHQNALQTIEEMKAQIDWLVSTVEGFAAGGDEDEDEAEVPEAGAEGTQGAGEGAQATGTINAVEKPAQNPRGGRGQGAKKAV